jgi:cytochrome c-type biogenesis protein
MSIAGVAANGPLVLAVGAATAAGVVSFLSPCVLPLVPGYLSYMTGLAGADLDASTDGDHAQRSRVLGRIVVGTLLFIAGFTVIFTLTSVVVANIGRTLIVHDRTMQIIGGVFVLVLGAAFLGFVPGMQREWRIRKLPSAGLLGAPVLGAVFAFAWVPCITPTLGAVMTLSLVDGRTDRAVTLSIAYCLGLGLPFLIFGLGFRRLIGVFRVIRRNSRWVTRIGGALLVVIGFALITDAWVPFLDWFRASVGPGWTGV